MQSPPASVEATSVIILSPVLARPGASPRSRRLAVPVGKDRGAGPRWLEEQAGIVHQAVIVEGDLDAVEGGCVVAFYWVLLLWGRVAVTKPLSQIQRSTFLPL